LKIHASLLKKIIREIQKILILKKRGAAEEILESYKDVLLKNFGETISGIYVIGSYALNDFNSNLSDIDFVVTVKKELNKNQIHTLSKIHREIEKKVIQPNLNGIYILDSKIGKEAKNIDTLISYHEGELKVEKNKDNYFGINPITWAEMEFFGMSIYGKKLISSILLSNIIFKKRKCLVCFWSCKTTIFISRK